MSSRSILLLLLPLLVYGGGISDDKCSQYSNCTDCTAYGDCVWCHVNGTGFCTSGTMFGVNSTEVSCPMMDWQYRQCSLSGFWVLFISALLLLLVILAIIIIVAVFYRRRTRGRSLSGDHSGYNKVHTLPLDVLIEKQSSAGLGITSLSDEGEDTVGSPQRGLATDSLKLALTVPATEADEELAPPLRQIGPWKEYQDDNGKYYYFNEETEQSVWDPPPAFKYSDEYEPTPEQEQYMANNTGRYLVRALYSYTATKPELWQLSFEEGDLMWVVDSHHEEAWWIGEKCDTGEQGYFAKDYVQVLKRTFKTTTKQGAKISALTKDLRESGFK